MALAVQALNVPHIEVACPASQSEPKRPVCMCRRLNRSREVPWTKQCEYYIWLGHWRTWDLGPALASSPFLWTCVYRHLEAFQRKVRPFRLSNWLYVLVPVTHYLKKYTETEFCPIICCAGMQTYYLTYNYSSHDFFFHYCRIETSIAMNFNFRGRTLLGQALAGSSSVRLFHLSWSCTW